MIDLRYFAVQASNVFYLAAGLLAWSRSAYGYAAGQVAVFAFSTLFHSRRTVAAFHALDVVIANLAAVYVAWWCILPWPPSPVRWTCATLCALASSVYVATFWLHDAYWHALWHTATGACAVIVAWSVVGWKESDRGGLGLLLGARYKRPGAARAEAEAVRGPGGSMGYDASRVALVAAAAEIFFGVFSLGIDVGLGFFLCLCAGVGGGTTLAYTLDRAGASSRARSARIAIVAHSITSALAMGTLLYRLGMSPEPLIGGIAFLGAAAASLSAGAGTVALGAVSAALFASEAGGPPHRRVWVPAGDRDVVAGGPFARSAPAAASGPPLLPAPGAAPPSP